MNSEFKEWFEANFLDGEDVQAAAGDMLQTWDVYETMMGYITQSNLDLLKRLEEQKKRILLVADEQNKKVYSEKPIDGIELHAITREREKLEKEMK